MLLLGPSHVALEGHFPSVRVGRQCVQWGLAESRPTQLCQLWWEPLDFLMPKANLGKSQWGTLVCFPPVILVNFRRDFGVPMEGPKARPKLLHVLNKFSPSFIYVSWYGQFTLEEIFSGGGQCAEVDQLSEQGGLDWSVICKLKSLLHDFLYFCIHSASL